MCDSCAEMELAATQALRPVRASRKTKKRSMRIGASELLFTGFGAMVGCHGNMEHML